jgi:hypothetical protein
MAAATMAAAIPASLREIRKTIGFVAEADVAKHPLGIPVTRELETVGITRAHITVIGRGGLARPI